MSASTTSQIVRLRSTSATHTAVVAGLSTSIRSEVLLRPHHPHRLAIQKKERVPHLLHHRHRHPLLLLASGRWLSSMDLELPSCSALIRSTAKAPLAAT